MNPKGNIVAGVEVVLISHITVIPRAFSITESCSNNVSEYNALVIGMQLAKEIGVKNLKAYSDFQSSSPTRFAESTESDMNTWCPTTTRTLS